MKKITLLTILIFGVFISSLTFMPEDIKTLSIGDKAPLISYKMLSTEGNKITLSSIKQENGYIVIFSCNTCPFVIGGNAFPGWEKDYNTISKWSKEAKLGIVLVNSNEAKRNEGDGMKDMKARAKEMSYNIPYVLDKKHQLADAFGAKTTPHIFVFDANDKLIYEGAIDNSWNPKVENKETFLKDALEAIKTKAVIKYNKTAPKGCSIKRIS